MERMQKRARERLWYTARCLMSLTQKLSSVCLHPDNRDWTGSHPQRDAAVHASTSSCTCIPSTFPMHVCTAMSRHLCHSLVYWQSIQPNLVSVLTTLSLRHVPLLLSFLLFMHAVLCQLKNIIPIQTGRESAGVPPACKFIWFARRRRSINLLRREAGVLQRSRSLIRAACVCVFANKILVSGCSCWRDWEEWQAWCFRGHGKARTEVILQCDLVDSVWP